MDSLLSTIDSELKSGIDVSLNAMLDVMKSFGTLGPRSLAEKIKQELHQLDQRKSMPPASPVEFNINDSVENMFLQLVHAIGNFLKASDCEFPLLRSCMKSNNLVTKLNSLPSDLIDKINSTNNLDELLEVLILSPHCNWINVCMFEKIVAFSDRVTCF